MTIIEQLKIIIQLSGLTQEVLAKRFDVSFPALNAWINGRANPRSKNRQAIGELYMELTGQKIIPVTELEAKKKLISAKSKSFGNITDFILKHRDIHEQLLLSFTYNTNRIEGSTMTEPDTATVLFRNKALVNRSLIEQLEAKNHQTAFNYVLESVQAKVGINELFILQLHRILMSGIIPDAGSYRTHAVRIVGANVPTTNPLKIKEQMRNLLEKVNTNSNNALAYIADLHARFEQIHPFSDGNGRVGRLVILTMLLESNLAPAVIEESKRSAYYASLNRAQIKNDTSQLDDFLCTAILTGIDILSRN